MTAAQREQWYRMVDAQHQGWHPVGSQSGSARYAADYGFKRDLPGRSLEELERDRGPLRPVLPITGEDEQDLQAALAAAGQKAVYTVAAAVFAALDELREQHGGLANPDSWTITRRQLLAGGEGSWESEGLISMAMWAGRGKSPRRVHKPSRRAITEMLLRWVTDPGRFTEVAATLACTVSRYADEHGGWPAIADQWLQPGALDMEGLRVTYLLLYWQSEHFDPDALA